jgi:hypothetical protein
MFAADRMQDAKYEVHRNIETPYVGIMYPSEQHICSICSICSPLHAFPTGISSSDTNPKPKNKKRKQGLLTFLMRMDRPDMPFQMLAPVEELPAALDLTCVRPFWARALVVHFGFSLLPICSRSRSRTSTGSTGTRSGG